MLKLLLAAPLAASFGCGLAAVSEHGAQCVAVEVSGCRVDLVDEAKSAEVAIPARIVRALTWEAR